MEIGGEIRTVSAAVVRRNSVGLALEWSDFAPEAAVALVHQCGEPAR